MLKLCNMGPLEFKKYCKNKIVYIYGAGRALESCMDIYFADKEITGIVDTNASKNKKIVRFNNHKINIITKYDFVKDVVLHAKQRDNLLVFISSAIYAAEIVEELDKISELDGIECFLQVFIRNTIDKYPEFDFTNGVKKIPKKIHYIWLGNKALPDEFKQNIASWKKYNPDYEIIQWNENNYDVNKTEYTKQAYQTNSFGFASNYMRLDIVHEYGGIYLDTDVEAVKNFDSLLNDDMFMCMGYSDRVNSGCGFGSIAGHELLKNIMLNYENETFIKNKTIEKRPGHNFLHPALKEYGFVIENQYQKVNNVVLYPTEVMSPLTIKGLKNSCSKKTLSVHKESSTWKTAYEQQESDKISNLLNRIF